MKHIRYRFMGIGVALSLVVLIFALTTVVAQVTQPTYEYEGEVLSADAFLKLVDEGVPLRCTPIPSKAWYFGDPLLGPTNYICFDNEEALSKYMVDVLAPQWDKIAEDNDPPPSPGPSNT